MEKTTKQKKVRVLVTDCELKSLLKRMATKKEEVIFLDCSILIDAYSIDHEQSYLK